VFLHCRMIWGFLQDLDVSYSCLQIAGVGYDSADQHNWVMNHQPPNVCYFNTCAPVLGSLYRVAYKSLCKEKKAKQRKCVIEQLLSSKISLVVNVRFIRGWLFTSSSVWSLPWSCSTVVWSCHDNTKLQSRSLCFPCWRLS